MMLKNITFSADPELIRLAKEKAIREKSTLNHQFRSWLERYVSTERRLIDYETLMAQLDHVVPGRKFSRDEMNER